MKPTKQKHGKENTIGKIIYGFLLFMPLLAIAVTCAYVIFNKNAYKSYYGENINQYNLTKVDNVNQFIEGYTYKFSSTGITQEISNNNNLRIYFTNLEDFSSGQTNIPSIENANSFCFTYYTSNFIVFYNNNTQITAINITNYQTNFTFEYVSNTYNNNFDNYYVDNTISRFDYLPTTFVSEAFYYSIDKVQESTLFNWSYNTATYNVLENTCNTLGITNNFVPMILSYWLMMSLMYLLYDIALLIVHMAHNRIHDIESSI